MQFEYVLLAVIAALLIGAAVRWYGVSNKPSAQSPKRQTARRSSMSRHDVHAPSSLHDINAVSELPSMLVASGDPIADATLNLRYGRTAQAVHILKEAFRAKPPMMDAGMKLAEVLLAANDIKNFNKVEARFKVLTKEEGPFWESLKILKADFLGTPEESNSSTYMDFSTTEISNLKGPVRKNSNHRPIGPPSQQV